LSKPQDMIHDSLLQVAAWVEAAGYKGYEPFDGLSSPLRRLTEGHLFADRLLLQLVRQSPLNLRPLLGIKPLESTKGRGYMAWGYLSMLKATGDRGYEARARACLDWLIGHTSPLYQEASWANEFAFSSRGGTYSKDTSIIVWTSLIGQAFLDAWEQLGDRRYLDAADSACRWVMRLPREKTERGTCISYLMTQTSSIHNSNMLGAAFLARTARHTGNDEYRRVAREAMEYSCSRQLPDGAWYYGEKEHFHWIDNFHSGYNLDSLKCYLESSGEKEWEANLARGLEYFKATFFDADGRPGYYHNRAYPIDIQCASQAITTLAGFGDKDPGSLELAVKVARWTIGNMQTKKGSFIYRIYPWGRARTPMLHWGQATMYKGLALLFERLGRR
jgi:rhamnogalacturonyl hydrolase YesR